MSENLPPPNRALEWYRFVLWLMPSCVCIAVFRGIDLIGRQIGLPNRAALALWILATVLSTILLAFFDARLSCCERRVATRSPEAEIVPNMILFLILQVILIVGGCFLFAMGGPI